MYGQLKTAYDSQLPKVLLRLHLQILDEVNEINQYVEVSRLRVNNGFLRVNPTRTYYSAGSVVQAI